MVIHQKFLAAARSILVAAGIGLFSIAAAGQARVHMMTSAQCELEPNVYHLITGVTIEIDGKKYELDGSSLITELSPGKHTLKASIASNPDAKLLWVNGEGTTRQMFHAQGGAAVVDLDPRGDNWEVRLETCVSEQAKVSRVKVIVTQSCTMDPAEKVEPVKGATVFLGNKSGTTDYDGTTVIEVKPGKYTVGATWKDAILGRVMFNGEQATSAVEAGLPTINVNRATGTVEVRFVTCDPSGSRKARATIASTGGGMWVKRFSRVSSDFATQEGFVGMTLRDGDEVEIMPGGELQWMGGGVISFNQSRFRGSTRIVIGPDAPAGVEGESVVGTSIRVLGGLIRVLIPPSEPAKKNRFEAATGTVKVSVKGTEFILDYDERSQISTLEVVSGQVEVTPVNAAVRSFVLDAGNAVEVNSSAVRSVPTTTGRTSTTAAGGLVRNSPLRVCEHFPSLSKEVCGTWTWDGGSRVIYRLDEGNVVELTVERLTADEIILTREDRTGPYGVYRARYVGRITGNLIQGQVSMTMGDISGTNTFTVWTNAGSATLSSGPTLIIEPGVDRPGADYRSVELPRDDRTLCWEACRADPNCKACTYVKPGVQGANARCWLKSSVPPGGKSDCCDSAIKRP